jgi:hypothetical protein
MKTLRATVLWVFLANYCAIANAQDNCTFSRLDYITPCGTSVDCLNNQFREIEKQINGFMDISKRRIYGVEENYRKAFCGEVVHSTLDFWNALGIRRQRGHLTPDQQYQLSQTAAVCNVTLLGEFLYQLRSRFCANE